MSELEPFREIEEIAKLIMESEHYKEFHESYELLKQIMTTNLSEEFEWYYLSKNTPIKFTAI